MKAFEQYFHVVLFIMLYNMSNVILTKLVDLAKKNSRIALSNDPVIFEQDKFHLQWILRYFRRFVIENGFMSSYNIFRVTLSQTFNLAMRKLRKILRK